LIVIVGNAERQMRGRYPEQTQLVGRPLYVPVQQHRCVGEEFEIVLHFPAIPPYEGVEPLENEGDLRQQDIQRMPAADMDLFMDKDLVVGFPVIVFRVDKNGVAESAGCAVAPDLNDPETTVPDHRA